MSKQSVDKAIKLRCRRCKYSTRECNCSIHRYERVELIEKCYNFKSNL